MPTEHYVEQLLGQDAELERVKQSMSQHDMPAISVAPGYGRLLSMLVRMSGAKNVLEIGALGGYSGICLMRGLPEDGRLTSLEIKAQFADVAWTNLKEAGYGNRVDYILGDAKASLAILEEKGRKFDFFFIDADKESYPVYLDWAIRLANPGAVITGDNALLHGRTIDTNKNGPSVVAMREFNERMVRDERLMGTLLPAYDGLAVAIVK